MENKNNNVVRACVTNIQQTTKTFLSTSNRICCICYNITFTNKWIIISTFFTQINLLMVNAKVYWKFWKIDKPFYIYNLYIFFVVPKWKIPKTWIRYGFNINMQLNQTSRVDRQIVQVITDITNKYVEWLTNKQERI